MPMYEYRCAACESTYEQLRRMSDADTGLQCPQCGSEQVERQVSACAVRGGGNCAPSGRGFT